MLSFRMPNPPVPAVPNAVQTASKKLISGAGVTAQLLSKNGIKVISEEEIFEL